MTSKLTFEKLINLKKIMFQICDPNQKVQGKKQAPRS